MAQNRFGTRSADEIESFKAEFGENANTTAGIRRVKGMFLDFCVEKEIKYDPATITDEELNQLLENFIVNVRKRDGTEYKELVIKVIFNSLASNVLMKDIKAAQKRDISIFKDDAFAGSRKAKKAKRRQLQHDPQKRTVNAAAISQEDKLKMLALYSDENPSDLNRRYYQYASFIFQWRGNEGANSLIHHYKEEKNLRGELTGRIEYNPIFTKNCPGGDKALSDTKYIEANGEVHLEAARLYRLILSKRPPNCKDDRFFLTPNKNWKISGNWYNTIPIGRNNMGTWTKDAAKAIGLDVVANRIVNQSERATAISLGAASNITPAQQVRLSGHNDIKSLESYTSMPPGWRGEKADEMLGLSKKTEEVCNKKIESFEKRENLMPELSASQPSTSSFSKPLLQYSLHDDPVLTEQHEKRTFIDFFSKPSPGFNFYGSATFVGCSFSPQRVETPSMPQFDPKLLSLCERPTKRPRLSVSSQPPPQAIEKKASKHE